LRVCKLGNSTLRKKSTAQKKVSATVLVCLGNGAHQSIFYMYIYAPRK
jgi:hypothetical protein